MTVRRLGYSLLLSVLAGCTVGPDFSRPASPEVAGYTPEPLAAQTTSASVPGGEAQRFVKDLDIPGQWWTLFRSEPLNALIEEALKANPNLQAAQAALRVAQENSEAQRGAFLPTVTGKFGVTRQKSSNAAFGAPGGSLFTLNTAGLDVSYAPDVFGGTRRGVEALDARVDYQRFQVEASYLTLTSNVVTAAIVEASLRAQVAAYEQIIEAEKSQLEVLQRQFDLGGSSKAAVLAQQANLAQTQAALPALQKQLAQQRNLLAALAGRFPSEEVAAKFDLAGLQLPVDLPVSLPSQLVDQRPDIRATEALLHAANAQIGVATAAKLPQFSLTASIGRTASDFSSLFQPGSGVWSIGAGLVQPIFNGGMLEHQRRSAIAARDQAAAQYRATVIAAFQNVADALRALQHDAEALAAQVAAERAAAASLELARDQFKLGAVSYLSLLTAEQTYQQARIALIQAQASRFSDTAALFQALGGGWWNRMDVALGENGRPLPPPKMPAEMAGTEKKQ